MLADGRYAMLDDGLGSSLVPSKPVIEQKLGSSWLRRCAAARVVGDRPAARAQQGSAYGDWKASAIPTFNRLRLAGRSVPQRRSRHVLFAVGDGKMIPYYKLRQNRRPPLKGLLNSIREE